ncbi:MAG: enoyl-CoA hydratase-related protein [Caulobacterales bacterium]
MTTDPEIFAHRDGAFAHLVLNRPAKRNALTMAMWRAIPAILADLTDQPGVRVLIVRGAGGAFAAGADIAEFERAYASREAALANQADMQAAMSALEDFPLPTIAAIGGACVGGGCGLALCCDVRIAAAGAKFGITPGKLGLAYGVADTRRLVQAVGLSAAKDILFTGRILDAEEAMRLSLVDRVVPAETLDETVQTYASTIAAASGYTARATKAILRLIREGASEDTEKSRAMFADAFEGADFREGRAAFLEKRAPDFSKS